MPNRRIIVDEPLGVIRDGPTISNPPTKEITGGMQIPFATGSDYLSTQYVSTNSSGAPVNVLLGAFTSGTYYQATLTGSLPYPTLGGSTSLHYFATAYFTMPIDATVEGIRFTATYKDDTNTITGTFYPFVAVATGITTPLSWNSFTILKPTQTIAKVPFVHHNTYSYGYSVTGENMSIKEMIPAGSNVAIICGIFQTDNLVTTQSTQYLRYSGVILLS